MSTVAAPLALKLGLNLEYLRGISSAAIHTVNDLQSVPYLLENQPALRYSASNVAVVLGSLASLLEQADLPKTRAAAESFAPLREEIETFLKENLGVDNVTLQDHFADRLVRIAEEVLKSLREEIG